MSSPHLFRFLGIVAFLLPGLAQAGEGGSTALQTARRQFAEFYLGAPAMPGGNVTLKDTNEPPPDIQRAKEYVATLEPDGRWPDLDYGSKANSGWPPASHWTRMLAIVVAEGTGRGDLDATASDAAVHRAFAYWIAHDFICPNWWYNQIGCPKTAATTALLFGSRLTAGERDYLRRVMLPRAKIGMTGQNRVWLAGNTLMAGLLEGDEAKVETAAKAIWGEIAVTTQEGIQPDFSFHQHGPQQQFGNYGMGLAVEICRWATVLRDTPFQLPTEKLAAYRSFLLEGEGWVLWRGRMDVSACDRQLMPHAQASKAATISQVAGNATQFDPGAAARYHALIARNARAAGANDLLGTRVFWRSDYVIHRRPEFAATLKMSSRRVVGAESLNSENLFGYYLADGALYVYRDGDEYNDIFPLWDWQKLPGTTCVQRPDGPPRFREVRGERDFVGGVTAGSVGCAALALGRDGLDARKAWFFGENAIACLGTEIRHSGPDPVVTTLNQCFLRGVVRIKQAEQDPVNFAGPERVFDHVDWIEHDGWRYRFLQPAKVHVSAETRSGNWHRVYSNPDTPRADVTGAIFSAWIEHDGSSNGRYAYVITPSAAPDALQLRENSADRQIVQLDDATVGIVFWVAGEAMLPEGRRVAVDHPCLVMLADHGRRVFLADPTQTLASLTLTVDGASQAVSLPQQGAAGSTIEVARR